MGTKERAEKAFDEIKHEIPAQYAHDIQAYIATLSRQLAESYAPCKECGDSPIIERRVNGWVCFCFDCHTGAKDQAMTHYETRAECLAAWNLTNPIKGQG